MEWPPLCSGAGQAKDTAVAAADIVTPAEGARPRVAVRRLPRAIRMSASPSRPGILAGAGLGGQGPLPLPPVAEPRGDPGQQSHPPLGPDVTPTGSPLITGAGAEAGEPTTSRWPPLSGSTRSMVPVAHSLSKWHLMVDTVAPRMGRDLVAADGRLPAKDRNNSVDDRGGLGAVRARILDGFSRIPSPTFGDPADPPPAPDASSTVSVSKLLDPEFSGSGCISDVLTRIWGYP